MRIDPLVQRDFRDWISEQSLFRSGEWSVIFNFKLVTQVSWLKSFSQLNRFICNEVRSGKCFPHRLVKVDPKTVEIQRATAVFSWPKLFHAPKYIIRSAFRNSRLFMRFAAKIFVSVSTFSIANFNIFEISKTTGFP